MKMKPWWALLALPLVTLGPALEAEAQSSRPDFLFERPGISVTFRGGAFLHRADSGIYDFAIERLTVERGDFRGGSFGMELGLWLGDRIEGTLGLDGGSASLDSESRNWLEADGQPIRQRTSVTMGPVISTGAKFYLLPRGESLSRLAWAPNRANAFVGAGAGLGWYEFSQSGDFVDEVEATIFTADFSSSGQSIVTYVSGGFEYGLTRRIALVTEARYLWGSEAMSGDFNRFDEIDLSGLRLTAGLALRF